MDGKFLSRSVPRQFRLPCALALGLIVLGVSCRKPSPVSESPSHIDLDKYVSVQKREGQDANLALCVSISGGGHRAGNFAAGVFIEMEKYKINSKNSSLLNEIDYFSAVSGGSIVASAYINALLGEQKSVSNNFSYTNWLNDDNFNGKRTLRNGFGLSLFPGAILHWPPAIFGIFKYNRGDYFQELLDKEYLGIIQNNNGNSVTRERDKSSLVKLEDIFCLSESGKTPKVPYLILNSSSLSNGAIIPFTPDILFKHKITEFKHKNEKYTIKLMQIDSYLNVPLAVGLKASTTFPFAVPPTNLKAENNLTVSLMDGGEADNLGVMTAYDVLTQERAPKRVLIVIDAGTDEERTATEKGYHSPFDIFRKQLGIGLKSWRYRAKDYFQKILKLQNIECIWISFDDLPLDLKVKCKAVGTKLNMGEKEQDMLILAGGMALNNHRDEIKRIFKIVN